MAAADSIAATCVDYNSDNGEIVPDTVKQANVSAKRSFASDLGKPSLTRTSGRDAASDSGYSSHTAATLGSADLQNSTAPLKSVPASAENRLGPEKHSLETGVGAMKGKPTVSNSKVRPEERTQPKPAIPSTATTTAPTSPMEPSRMSRSGSQSQRLRQQARPDEECNNPNCDCQRKRAPSSPSSRPGLGIHPSYSSGLPPPHPSSTYYYTPPSPRTQRYPSSYMSAGIIETSQPRRRPMVGARPMTYYEGMSQDGFYASRMPYSTLADPRGPPPSASAYTSPAPQSFPMPYLQMGSNTAGSGPYAQMHEAARQVPPRPLESFSARGLPPNYPPPQFHYEQPTPSFHASSHPSANHNPSMRNPSARHNDSYYRPHTLRHDASCSSSEGEGEPDDRKSMPPPPIPTRRRPDIRHGATYDTRSTARRLHVDPRSNPPSANSSRRPSLVHHGRSKSKSYAEPGVATTVESSTSRRRMSYRAHDDIESRRRAAEEYQKDISARAPSNRRRRDTAEGTSVNRNGKSTSRRSVIIDGPKAELAVPLTEEALRRAKRSSRSENIGIAVSDTGSGRSKGSSGRNGDNAGKPSGMRMTSDGRTLSGSSNSEHRLSGKQGGMASPVNEYFHVRFGDMNLEVQGNMEGRTISVEPQEDGKTAFVIGERGDQERQVHTLHEVDGFKDRDNERAREREMKERERVMRARHRERNREGGENERKSYRMKSSSRVRGQEDGDYDRTSRRRRSSKRDESYSRPINAVPTVVSGSTTSSSTTSHGGKNGVSRSRKYSSNEDPREYRASPHRSQAVRPPSSHAYDAPVIERPVRHSSRSRSPHRSRSRYRSSGGRVQPLRQESVIFDSGSSDDEDTAREYQPSSVSSAATYVPYNSRAASHAAAALRTLESERRPGNGNAVSSVSSRSGSSSGRYGSQYGGSVKRANIPRTGPPSAMVTGSARSSAVFDEEDEETDDHDDDDDEVYEGAQSWI